MKTMKKNHKKKSDEEITNIALQRLIRHRYKRLIFRDFLISLRNWLVGIILVGLLFSIIVLLILKPTALIIFLTALIIFFLGTIIFYVIYKIFFRNYNFLCNL